MQEACCNTVQVQQHSRLGEVVDMNTPKQTFQDD